MSLLSAPCRGAKPALLALLVLISPGRTALLASPPQAPDSQTAAPLDADELRRQAAALLAEQGSLCAAGQLAAAREKGKQALALFAQLGDLYGQADTEAALGFCAIKTSQKDAGEHFKTSLALYKQRGDGMGSWAMLMMLGMLENVGGQAKPAEKYLRQALAVLDEEWTAEGPIRLESLKVLGSLLEVPPFDLLRTLPPTAQRLFLLPPFEAQARAVLAQPLTQQERFGEAEAELKQALAISRSRGGMLDYMLLGILAQLQRNRWRLDEAAQSLHDALTNLDALEKLLPSGVKFPPIIRLGLLSQLQEVELLRGSSADALRWNDLAQDLARQTGDLRHVVRALCDRAALYTGLGDSRQAAASLVEATRLAEKVEDRELLAVLRLYQAIQALNVGRYEDAISWLELDPKHLLQQSPEGEAAAQLVLAQSYILIGASARARSALERSLDLARTSGSPDIEIFALMAAQRLPKGLSLPKNRLEVRQSIGNLLKPTEGSSSPLHLLIQMMAFDLLRPGKGSTEPCLATRLQLAQHTMEVAEAKGYSYIAAVARLPLALCHVRRGEVDQARRELETALSAIASSGQKDFAALARVGVAAMLWKQGHRKKALEESKTSIAAYENLAIQVQTDDLLAAFFGGDRSLPFQVMVDMLAQDDQARKAFEYAEKARSRALLRLLENQRLRAAPGTDSALQARADELRQQILRQERFIPASDRETAVRMQAEVENLHRELEELLLRIRLVKPEYAELVSEQPASLEAIQQALEPGTALISYFLLSKDGMAWVIDRENVRWVSLPLKKGDLEAVECMNERVTHGRTMRGPIPIPQRGDCKPWDTLSRRLYQKLIAPLALDPHRQRLILIPHGVLHGLPFAALRNPRTGRYLIEEHCLSFAPSASIVPLLRSRRSAPIDKALVLGNPASAEPSASRLEWAEQEASQVAHVLGTQPLVGAAATESRLREALSQGADLLHVAAHGVFLPNHPRFSYLALAADPGKEGHLYDGRLEMDEVFAELDLTKVQLVVLSACDTAQGQRTEGDEVLGLVRSFLYAGSAGVLATLWNVDDAASAHLMVTFYRRLREGARPAEALQQAQIEMVHDPGHEDPFFWAAYQLTGDPGIVTEPSLHR